MSNHLFHILSQWLPRKDQSNWVLGTVFKTEGPAYRKAGAMMLFSDSGEQFGMLSGGCLESDIHLQARKVMLTKKPKTLTYDGSDEDDLAFQLGIGCGGTVHVLLQPISSDNNYLCLPDLFAAMKERRKGEYLQKIAIDEVYANFSSGAVRLRSTKSNTQLIKDEKGLWLSTQVEAPLHLLIAGGGIDARPVANIALQLGWEVTIWDPRPANARPEYFPEVKQRLAGNEEELTGYCKEHTVQAAILMTHNVELDSKALFALKGVPLSYIALLGPINRRDRVLSQSGVAVDELSVPLSGPAGLDIGAELPETIALAILAECQAAMSQTTAASLSGVLPENESLKRAAS